MRETLTSPLISACIELLFRTEHPGSFTDKVRGCRDLIASEGGLGLASRGAAAATLLTRRGQADPFAARIRACKAVGGIDAVEFWSWRNKDLNAIERALDETGLALTGFMSEPTGRLVDRATHAAFIAGLRESVSVALRLGASHLIVLAGDALPGVATQGQRAALVAALRAAAVIAGDAGLTIVLEPVNSRLDHAGAFLDLTQEGLAIVAEVENPAVRLLFDAYHAVTMGEAPATLFGNGRGALVGHVHLADVPGRREPGSGTIDWPPILAALYCNGYAGAVGLEYRATGGRTAASLQAALQTIRGRWEPRERPAPVPLQSGAARR